VRYCQDSDSEELKDSYEDEKWKPKNKETKDNSETIIRGVYNQNCYNEIHLAKECKLLNKFCQICRQIDHNINQCPSKAVFRRCPSRGIVPMHVVQGKAPIVQEQKQLQKYNTTNNQFGNQQYNSRPNG
jgi:hypothetical protein